LPTSEKLADEYNTTPRTVRRYNREKMKHGGDRKSSGQNDHLKTSEKTAYQEAI